MRTLAAVTAAVLLLTGCAQKMTWHRPGVTQTEFTRDKYECLSQNRSTGAAYIGWGIVMPMEGTNERMNKLCMEARGYELVKDQDPGVLFWHHAQVDDQTAQAALLQCQREETTTGKKAAVNSIPVGNCMQRLGYTLLTTERWRMPSDRTIQDFARDARVCRPDAQTLQSASDDCMKGKGWQQATQ